MSIRNYHRWHAEQDAKFYAEHPHLRPEPEPERVVTTQPQPDTTHNRTGRTQ